MKNSCFVSYRLWVGGFVLLCVVGAAVAEKKAKPAKEGRRVEMREIEGMEQQWRSAIMNGDTGSLDRLLSDDFLAISARGTLSDKQQYLYRIAHHTTHFSEYDLMDLKVRLQPHGAVAISQTRIAGLLEGKPIEGTFRYTKVYTHGPAGAWHVTNFEATRVSPMASTADDMEQGRPLDSKSAK